METCIYSMSILLIDDDVHILKGIEILLKTEGYTNIFCCSESRDAVKFAEKIKPAVILTDLIMPGLNGEELINLFSVAMPNVPVIVVTEVHDVNTVIRCMRSAVHDFITKPVDETRLLTALKKALCFYIICNENINLQESLLSGCIRKPQLFKEIITGNHQMYAIFKYIEAIADSPCPVLITGETGTGKENIAKAIHEAGKINKKFIGFNVAGIDDSMFSDTLFGHEKGSFTGASERRRGLVEDAADGTLFLDEIGDLSIQSQIKLLRLIQEQKYYAVGSDELENCEARIIAATNVSVERLKESEEFRKDLFYRLFFHHIHVPALRERRDDIPLLTEYFIVQAAEKLKCKVPSVHEKVFLMLMNYDFPGNIRELKAVLFDAVAESRGEMLIPVHFKKIFKMNEVVAENKQNESIQFPTLSQLEERYIKKAMIRCKWNQTDAAKLLGISRQTLNKKLKSLKLS